MAENKQDQQNIHVLELDIDVKGMDDRYVGKYIPRKQWGNSRGGGAILNISGINLGSKQSLGGKKMCSANSSVFQQVLIKNKKSFAIRQHHKWANN